MNKMYAIYRKLDGTWWVRDSEGNDHGPFDTRQEAVEFIIKQEGYE